MIRKIFLIWYCKEDPIYKIIHGKKRNIRLNLGHHKKHFFDVNNKNYIEGKSILYISAEEAQELLDKFAGKGEMTPKCTYKEVVNFGKVIGESINKRTGTKTPTTWGKIHYGNRGAHIVPTYPEMIEQEIKEMYYLSKKEEKIIDDFYGYVHIDKEHMKETYCMKWKNGTEILGCYCTDGDDDNGLEPEDPSYEEYTSFIVRIKKLIKFNDLDGFKKFWLEDGVLFEFSYHDFPDEIYNSKGELISKKKE